MCSFFVLCCVVLPYFCIFIGSSENIDLDFGHTFNSLPFLCVCVCRSFSIWLVVQMNLAHTVNNHLFLFRSLLFHDVYINNVIILLLFV